MEVERRIVINEPTSAASGSPIAPVVSVRVKPTEREKENKYVALEKKKLKGQLSAVSKEWWRIRAEL